MISVIITIYNGERYIAEQLESIFAQTYKNYEIILIDDNSHDKSLEIVNDVIKKNTISNIRILRNKHNIGVNKSLMVGINNSSGEFIAICDQDDIWRPLKLETLKSEMDKLSCNVIYAPSYLIKKNKKVKKLYPSPRNFNTLFYKYFINNMRGASSLVRKEFLEEILPFPEEDIYDKWIYFTSLYLNNINSLSVPLDYYRVHNKNIVGEKYKYRSTQKLKSDFIRKKVFYNKLKNFVLEHDSIQQNDVLKAISDIMEFIDSIIDSLGDPINIKYLKYVNQYIRKSEFSLKEKLIYTYYYLLK